MSDPVHRIVEYFERLTRNGLARLGEVYTEDAYFKDPFNEVRGLAEVERIYLHMFDVLDQPRFVIHERIVQGNQCMLTWDFQFCFKRGSAREQVIRGSSHLKLAADGRIAYHRDYWDAAEELYEKLPLLGALMRWLRRQANR